MSAPETLALRLDASDALASLERLKSIFDSLPQSAADAFKKVILEGIDGLRVEVANRSDMSTTGASDLTFEARIRGLDELIAAALRATGGDDAFHNGSPELSDA